MDRGRTALYLDFDNVFSGLLKIDPGAAIAFAEHPSEWLQRLSTSYLVDSPRSWLVRRCYMNPAGSVAHPDPSQGRERLYFSRFRPHFTRAGFEVIDCPSLTYQSKNLADIRMVLDAMDALSGPTRYDEYVIASGDSDLTPLLVRLRAADRRTTIISPADASQAFTNVADRFVDGQQTLALLQDELDEEGLEEALSEGAPEAARELEQDGQSEGGLLLDEAAITALKLGFRRQVTDAYRSANEAINLAILSSRVQRELGPGVQASRWFGHGSFTAALDSLDLPQARRNNYHIWNEQRHPVPQVCDGNATPQVAVPAVVAELCTVLNVPRLAEEVWPRAYETLALFARDNTYNLNQATKWSRGMPFVSRASASA